MNTSERKQLAASIEMYLIMAGDWVRTSEICQHFGVTERALRAHEDTPGLLDDFAVSSDRSKFNGYIHHCYLSDEDFDSLQHSKRKHSLAVLLKLRRMRRARHNCLTGNRDDLHELHSGQGVMAKTLR